MLQDVKTEILETSLEKLAKEKKLVEKGKKRKFFLSAEIVPLENVCDFLSKQNKYTMNKLSAEKKKAFEFLCNEEEARKHGLYNRKENPQMIAKWAEKAYPKMNVDLFDVMFEEKEVKNELERRKNG